MFKEAEKGEKEVFIERTEEALKTGADIIATACPWCHIQLEDAVKTSGNEGNIEIKDIAELLAEAVTGTEED